MLLDFVALGRGVVSVMGTWLYLYVFGGILRDRKVFLCLRLACEDAEKNYQRNSALARIPMATFEHMMIGLTCVRDITDM